MIQGKWKSDGTDADSTKATWSQTLVQGDDSATHNQVHTLGGSPMNLLFEMSDSPLPPTFYLQVTVTEFESQSTSISVGVARPEEFKKGYGIKGMFYNGNLTNGSAALKVSYGPRLSAGDVLVVEYTETNNEESTMQVILHLNGNCLGTGFCIPKTESAFVPCISVKGQLQFQAQVLSEKPVIDSPIPLHPLAGKWTMTEASSSEEDGSSSPIWPLPSNPMNQTVVLSMEPQPSNIWSIAVKVANNLGMQAEIAETSTGNNTFALQGGGHVRSTRMMPPPPLDQVERKLSRCMETSWKEMRVEQGAGDTLSILVGSGNTVAKCIRVQPSHEPACTSYK